MTGYLFIVTPLAGFLREMSVEYSINAIAANAFYALTRYEEMSSLDIGEKIGKVFLKDRKSTAHEQGEA